MKNHGKRSEKQPAEDWERKLNIKCHAVNQDMAKVSSERRSASLHRCTRSLKLGMLGLIVSIGIGLIPGLPSILSPVTAFAFEPPPVPSPTCAGCNRKISQPSDHGPDCPYRPRSTTGTGTGKTPTIILPQSTSRSLALGIASTFLQGLFANAFSPAEQDSSDLAGAAERAKMAEAWVRSEKKRLDSLVTLQRAKREAESKVSQEELAKVMGDQWSGNVPKSDLASVLSDPNVVDLRGKEGIVDPYVLKQSDPKRPKLKAQSPPALGIKELDKLMTESLRQLKEDQDKLSKALDNYSGPLVAPQTYNSVHFMGILNSQEDADKLSKQHLRNINDGLPYEKIVAFGQRGVLDVGRGFWDREAAQLAMLSPMTLAKCHSLKGATINDLVVHSNAATVTEVLLRKGYIKHVDKLSILGGDRSLANLAGWEELIRTKKVKEITIYVNKGDPVPWLPQLKDISSNLAAINYAAKMSKSLSHQGLVKVIFFNKKPYECASDITISLSAAIDYHQDIVYHYNGMKYNGTDKIVVKHR